MMKTQIRKNVFETNSSATHALSIVFSNKFEFTTYTEEEYDDIYLGETDVENFMEHIPTEMLEKELEKRKQQNDD